MGVSQPPITLFKGICCSLLAFSDVPPHTQNASKKKPLLSSANVKQKQGNSLFVQSCVWYFHSCLLSQINSLCLGLQLYTLTHIFIHSIDYKINSISTYIYFAIVIITLLKRNEDIVVLSLVPTPYHRHVQQ